MQILGINRQKAERLLKKSNWDVKVAVIMGRKKVSYKEAKDLLTRHGGFLGKALNN